MCVFRRRSEVQISDSYPNQFPHLEVSQIGCEKIVSRSGFGVYTCATDSDLSDVSLFCASVNAFKDALILMNVSVISRT